MHAKYVERHIALWSDVIHRGDSQLRNDGILDEINIEHRISETTFAKNALQVDFRKVVLTHARRAPWGNGQSKIRQMVPPRGASVALQVHTAQR